MYIGELSKQSGASPKAIRHYEALGLLGTVRRSGAYRDYSAQQLQQVCLIRRAQAMGLRLADLAPLAATEPDWAALLGVLANKQQALRHEVVRLQQMDGLLEEVKQEIARCLSAQASAASCQLP